MDGGGEKEASRIEVAKEMFDWSIGESFFRELLCP